MSNSVYRRCGCREGGKQLGDACPQLVSDPRHGTWGFYFRYKTEPDPKRPGKLRSRQFRKHGFASKRQAQSAATKLRASLDARTYVEPTKITLADYSGQWLARRQVTGSGLKASRLSGYRKVHRGRHRAEPDR
jgi:hypothetical protein